MFPIVFAMYYFLSTFIREIIYNKVNNKPHIVELKYKLYALLKKNDYRLDEIEEFIIKHENTKDAQRLRSILRKNNIKTYSVNQIQDLIETGEIENIISAITDKQSTKEIKEIIQKYGTEIGFMKLRIRYETKSMLDTEKSFPLSSVALSILSTVLGYYLVQDVWNLFCANWINLLIVAIISIIDMIVFYNKNHVIPDEVMPIIRNIQSKLME